MPGRAMLLPVKGRSVPNAQITDDKSLEAGIPHMLRMHALHF